MLDIDVHDWHRTSLGLSIVESWIKDAKVKWLAGGFKGLFSALIRLIVLVSLEISAVLSAHAVLGNTAGLIEGVYSDSIVLTFTRAEVVLTIWNMWWLVWVLLVQSLI